VRVVAGSNPAAPTNQKSFVFNRLWETWPSESTRPVEDCAQFCVPPAILKRADNFGPPKLNAFAGGELRCSARKTSTPESRFGQ